jgi:hypothetical protein
MSAAAGARGQLVLAHPEWWLGLMLLALHASLGVVRGSVR